LTIDLWILGKNAAPFHPWREEEKKPNMKTKGMRGKKERKRKEEEEE
jgi:hypothetical protein